MSMYLEGKVMANNSIFLRNVHFDEDDFVITSKVLLFGYKNLSGDAKVTYQVLRCHDWKEKETKQRKGYVYPAIKTLSEERGVSERTTYRHIEELIKVGLIIRRRRSHQISYLYIQNVSDKEKQLYLEKYVYKSDKKLFNKKSIAKNVNRLTASHLPKLTIDNIEEEKGKEDKTNVNENLKIGEGRKSTGMSSLNDIMTRFDIVKHNQTKNPPKKEKPEYILKRDYLAQEIADTFNDQKSLGFYRKAAEVVPEPVIREYMASIKETQREGKIRKSRGALLVHMILQYCEKNNIDLGIKNKTTHNNL